MKQINKILIITTEGCSGCNTTRHNIKEAISQVSYNIEIELKDWHDIPRDFIRAQKIKDFPTVLYLINERVVNKSVGTYPTAIYLRWIDIHFKK